MARPIVENDVEKSPENKAPVFQAKLKSLPRQVGLKGIIPDNHSSTPASQICT